MKILMVSEDVPARQLGGLGKHAVALANALIDAGHEVAFLGRSDRDFQSCAGEVGFRGTFIPGFDLSRTGWKERQLGFFNPLKRPYLAKRLAAAILRHAVGFDVVHYHGHLPLVGRYLPADINFVQSRHDQGSDCLVHTRFRRGAVCNELDPRVCAECIHERPGRLRSILSATAVRVYRRQTAEAFRRHRPVFVSEFLLRAISRSMDERNLSRAQVIHNFVDDSRLAAIGLAAKPLADGLCNVVVVGRIDEAKGIGAFLEECRGKLPDHVRVQIVGDGPDRPVLEQRFAGPRVCFLGWRSNSEALEIVARSDVAVVPSLCEEAFGLSTLEALRIGKPCLALARGATPELERYGVSGQLRLFPTTPALVEGLRELARGSIPRYSPCSGATADVRAALPHFLSLYAGRPADEER